MADPVDVIAAAIHTRACDCRDWTPRDPTDPQYDEQAEAVVAAIRGMDAETLAALIGGPLPVEWQEES